MTPALALTTGLVIAILLGGATVLLLWKVHFARLQIAEGLKILAGMRWRELSNLVVEALGSAGFDPESKDGTAQRGQQAELVVRREGRPWLLACKQGLAYCVTEKTVQDMVQNIRVNQAAGGLVVTPGRVAPAARLVAANVELLDGPQLWQLVEPLLPASVHEEVRARARSATLRNTAIAVVAAAVLAFVLAWTLPRVMPETLRDDDVTPRVVQQAPTTTIATAPAAPGPQLSEDEQRRQLAARLSGLPGVDRAIWSTRSTLQIFLTDPVLASDTAICQVVERYEPIRASRLQMQAPPGSDRPVRFIQCKSF
jgi:membrane protein implicated in regulation of membrane protease activity